IVDALGCTASVQVILSGSGEPVVSAGEDQSLTCRDTSFTIGGHLPALEDIYTFRWYFNDLSNPLLSGNANIVVSNPGLYILETTDKLSGCFSFDTLELINNKTPFSQVEIEFLPPSCHGDSNGFIRITNIEGGAEPFIFNLNGQLQPALAVSQLSAGSYL